jgi:hypothetical protein
MTDHECTKCEEGFIDGGCGACAGSGEGLHDGSTCSSCGGSGEGGGFCDCEAGQDAESNAESAAEDAAIDRYERKQEYEQHQWENDPRWDHMD